MNENKFYDQGWNARVDRVRYDVTKPREWRDGWRDCHDDIDEGNPPQKMTEELANALG
jgi:hypothetical protein